MKMTVPSVVDDELAFLRQVRRVLSSQPYGLNTRTASLYSTLLNEKKLDLLTRQFMVRFKVDVRVTVKNRASKFYV